MKAFPPFFAVSNFWYYNQSATRKKQKWNRIGPDKIGSIFFHLHFKEAIIPICCIKLASPRGERIKISTANRFNRLFFRSVLFSCFSTKNWTLKPIERYRLNRLHSSRYEMFHILFEWREQIESILWNNWRKSKFSVIIRCWKFPLAYGRVGRVI